MNDKSENVLSITKLFADASSLLVSASYLRDTEGLLNLDLILVSTQARQWLVNLIQVNRKQSFLYRQTEEFPTLIFDGVDTKFCHDKTLHYSDQLL